MKGGSQRWYTLMAEGGVSRCGSCARSERSAAEHRSTVLMSRGAYNWCNRESYSRRIHWSQGDGSHLSNALFRGALSKRRVGKSSAASNQFEINCTNTCLRPCILPRTSYGVTACFAVHAVASMRFKINANLQLPQLPYVRCNIPAG